MKRTYPIQIGELVNALLEHEGLTLTMARQQACFLWAEVTGPAITRSTMRRYVDDAGVLHVYLDSAPLRAELGYHTDALLKQLNDACGQEGALTDIRYH